MTNGMKTRKEGQSLRRGNDNGKGALKTKDGGEERSAQCNQPQWQTGGGDGQEDGPCCASAATSSWRYCMPQSRFPTTTLRSPPAPNNRLIAPSISRELEQSARPPESIQTKTRPPNDGTARQSQAYTAGPKVGADRQGTHPFMRVVAY